MVAARGAQEIERSNRALTPWTAPLMCDPLVIALGQHIIRCAICRVRGRASCPEGRSLSDAAAMSETVAYERRKGWRA